MQGEPLLRGQPVLLCVAQQWVKVLCRRDQGAVSGVCKLARDPGFHRDGGGGGGGAS